ncbi:MAG TPA: hypothetical protein VI299_15620, partial [Polyangiales bacterium]
MRPTFAFFVALSVGCTSASDAAAPAQPTPVESRKALEPVEARPVEPRAAQLPLRWSEVLGLRSIEDVGAAQDGGGVFGELSRGDRALVPKSCNEWRRLHDESYEPSSTLEVPPDLAAKARCEALLLLQHAAPAQRSFVRDLKLEPKLLPQLPAALAPAWSPEAIAKVEAASLKSLKEVAPTARAKPGPLPDSLEITSRDGYVLLEPLAWGDFDADGTEDVLVSALQGADQGSVLGARVVALTRSGA